MVNGARKWLPLLLIVTTVVVTALAIGPFTAPLALSLDGLLPFAVAHRDDTLPAWVLTLLLPTIAALVWALFRGARTASGLRMLRSMFTHADESATDAAVLTRYGAAYDAIAFWVVVLVLTLHAGIVAAALGHGALATRIIGLGIGVSIAAMGNVMPRLRPNLMAGVRTRDNLADGSRWRATHRRLGFGFVGTGVITIVVALVAPSYALVTALVLILASTIGASVSSGGRPGVVVAAIVSSAAAAASAPTK